MVDLIIKDIECALDNNAFLSALSLSLMLPDICGKAKYPKEKNNKKRYIGWYDEYVGKYEKCSGYEDIYPYLSGEVVYNLRCNFLHQGNPNIEKDRINQECCKIDEFILETGKKKDFNALIDSSGITSTYCGNQKINTGYKTYRVNVRRLCFIITANARAYYEKNKDLFNFFNYKLIDKDKKYKETRIIK